MHHEIVTLAVYSKQIKSNLNGESKANQIHATRRENTCLSEWQRWFLKAALREKRPPLVAVQIMTSASPKQKRCDIIPTPLRAGKSPSASAAPDEKRLFFSAGHKFVVYGIGRQWAACLAGHCALWLSTTNVVLPFSWIRAPVRSSGTDCKHTNVGSATSGSFWPAAACPVGNIM